MEEITLQDVQKRKDVERLEKYSWLREAPSYASEEQGIALDDEAFAVAEKYPKVVDRPEYRAGNTERSARVYTVNMESRYITISNIPSVGAIEDLVQRFSVYGAIEEYRILDHIDKGPFTDVVWIRYHEINNARHAKIKGSRLPFYGSILKIEYAPEYESVDDTRKKLEERYALIKKRTTPRETRSVEVGRRRDSLSAHGPMMPPRFQNREKASSNHQTDHEKRIVNVKATTSHPLPGFPRKRQRIDLT